MKCAFRSGLCALVLALAGDAHAILAFPEAMGAGAISTGGRGGTVRYVTNTNNSGAGSFRQALIDHNAASGPSVILCATDGTMTLNSELPLTRGNLTIDFRTCPGQGVQIRVNTYTPGLYVDGADDVVIRGLKFRPFVPAACDPYPVGDSCSQTSVIDAVTVANGSERVIFDHCEFSFATDEGFDATGTGTDDITVQYSLLAENLYDAALAGGNVAGFGVLIPQAMDGDVSLCRNGFVSNDERTPQFAGSGYVEFVNNVVVDNGDAAVGRQVDNGTETPHVNFIGNHIAVGTGSTATNAYIIGPVTTAANQLDSLYWHGNSIDTDFTDGELYVDGSGTIADYDRATPWTHIPTPCSVLPASGGRTEVLSADGAGGTVRLNADGTITTFEDTMTTRIRDALEAETGQLVNHPTDVGGFPTLTAGTAWTDTDSDGMPDTWETARGFDTADATDGPLDRDGDGWTNLEEFLNGTNPNTPPPTSLSGSRGAGGRSSGF